MAILFIAIGTNIGNRTDNLKTAIASLSKIDIKPTKLSRVYETAPMYVEDQPRFLNMVIQAETTLSCTDILKQLKLLETEIGRIPNFRNGPRLIDLDILYLEYTIINNDDLQIPHLRIAERQFVLQPLLDINPDWFDIRSQKTVKQMAEELEPDETLTAIMDNLPA